MTTSSHRYCTSGYDSPPSRLCCTNYIGGMKQLKSMHGSMALFIPKTTTVMIITIPKPR